MKPLLLLISTIVIVFQVEAQINATTDDGRSVILLRDGTWKFQSEDEKKVSFECESLTKKSGDNTGSSSPLILNAQTGKKLALTLIKSSDGLINLMINADGAGDCTKKGSAIQISYRDNTNEKIANDAESNCNKRLNVTLGKPTKDNSIINKLKKIEIASVSVYTQGGNVGAILDSQQSKIFLNTLWCLAAK